MSTLISTLLMGLVLLGLLIVIGRVRHWRPAPDRILESDRDITGLLNSPSTWTIVFIVLAFVFTAGAIAFASESAALPIDTAQLGLLVGGAVALVISTYIMFGIYFSAKTRGFKTAQAVGLSTGALGVLFLIAIALRLLMG